MKQLYVSFIDITAKAFDTVICSEVWIILEKVVCKSKFLRSVFKLHGMQWEQVKCTGNNFIHSLNAISMKEGRVQVSHTILKHNDDIAYLGEGWGNQLIHLHTHTQPHAHTHTYAHTHIHTHTHTHTHAHTHTRIHTHTHAHTHTLTHTHMHTHTRTHTRTHTHTHHTPKTAVYET